MREDTRQFVCRAESFIRTRKRDAFPLTRTRRFFFFWEKCFCKTWKVEARDNTPTQRRIGKEKKNVLIPGRAFLGLVCP